MLRIYSLKVFISENICRIYLQDIPVPIKHYGSGRKAWLLIKIFTIHSPSLLSSFFRREEKRGSEKTKLWSKVMPFCSIILMMNFIGINKRCSTETQKYETEITLHIYTIYTGWSKKILWIDLEEKCLRNS